MYVIAYDITNDKERKRLADSLSELAERIQKSVWVSEASLTTIVELVKKHHIKTGVVDIWQAEAKRTTIGEEKEKKSRKWAFQM